jgi:poly-beta-1,6-N-acetyl-D-glucosamine synthase
VSQTKSYVLVSPVKDEEKYIARTIQSVLQQTVLPSAWIIVDDGSRDRTMAIVNEFAPKYPWIKVLTLATDRIRQPGSGIIRAFNAGYEVVKDQPFDFIVKFDCDIEFPPDYFAELLKRFEQDEKLGIASGIYLEEQHGDWIRVKMPAYHAAGQTKMVRAQCFQEIGGFVASRGWDTVDEIRAQSRGWKTRHFEELYFWHLKKEGSGIGLTRTNAMHGEIYYLTGGGKGFFLLKLLHRLIFGKPFFVGGVLLLWGYLRSWLSRKSKLVSPVEEDLYQDLLNQRIVERLLGVTHVRN